MNGLNGNVVTNTYSSQRRNSYESAMALRRRHRKSDDEEMSGGARCCFGFLTFLAQILLHGVVGLVLFWVIAHHSKDNVGPFSFRTDPELEWNLHPVLMILGFIYFMGQAMLMYRTCRCCRRIWSKLLHTIFHLLAAPCIALGFVALVVIMPILVLHPKFRNRPQRIITVTH